MSFVLSLFLCPVNHTPLTYTACLEGWMQTMFENRAQNVTIGQLSSHVSCSSCSSMLVQCHTQLKMASDAIEEMPRATSEVLYNGSIIQLCRACSMSYITYHVIL